MTAPPGPKPPGSPADCEALAVLCDSYAGVLEDEMSSASRVQTIVTSGTWTGRAADYVRQAVRGWLHTTGPAAGTLRDLAGRLRQAASELEQEQAAWRRQADAYAADVRDKSRWGRT